MNCDKYEKRELGQLDELSFQRHAGTCDTCQARQSEDARLLGLARELERPAESPQLWGRIEASLETARQQQARPSRRVWMYRAAAVLVVGAGLGALVQQGAGNNQKADPGLYSSQALAKARNSQQEYAAAVAELEQVAGARFELMDMELAILYRDKIETIDTQIARCQDALRRNPANTHIHRYLLAALQDKRETLEEVLQL